MRVGGRESSRFVVKKEQYRRGTFYTNMLILALEHMYRLSNHHPYTHLSTAPHLQRGPVLQSGLPLLAALLLCAAATEPGVGPRGWPLGEHHLEACLLPPAVPLAGHLSPPHHMEQPPQTQHQRTPTGDQCSTKGWQQDTRNH